MLAAGENANGIIASLTRYFQKLWVLQELRSKRRPEAEIIKFMGTAPKFLNDYYIAANNYTGSDIPTVFEALLDADCKLKSSGGEAKLVLTMMLHAIIRRAAAVTSEFANSYR